MKSVAVENPFVYLQHLELSLNQVAQENLIIAEPLWIFLSEHFSTAKIMDVYVPFIAIFHHPLLVRLVCALGVINLFSSLIKWCSPEWRPYWWIREYSEVHKNTTLLQHNLTCGTTPAFPSSHAMTFTIFIYLLVTFVLTWLSRHTTFDLRRMIFVGQLIVLFTSMAMWLSRIYLGAQFLHQCILSSLTAVCLLHAFDNKANTFYVLGKKFLMKLIAVYALLPTVVYFGLLLFRLDPHWSVRLAFKWCTDPSYLRLEESPFFILARDFGFIVGMALSAPLFKRANVSARPVKRFPFLLAVEMLNYHARQNTPKLHGRIIFIAYEFVRNALHCFTLLSILPKYA